VNQAMPGLNHLGRRRTPMGVIRAWVRQHREDLKGAVVLAASVTSWYALILLAGRW
jgi:hypothetical protein